MHTLLLPALLLPLSLVACARPLPEAPRTLAQAERTEITEPPPPAPTAASGKFIPKEDDGVTAAYRGNGLRPVGGGTGFFVDAFGHVLTNAHVIAPCSALSVETTDGTEYRAERPQSDPASDLALIETGIAAPGVATFRDKVRLDGRPVAVIGYPDHGLQRITPEMVKGELSGPTAPDGRHFVARIDLRPGNSGGPLFEESGLVDGVVYGKINSVAVYRNTGKNIGDIGFVITADAVREFLSNHGVVAQTAADAPKEDDRQLFASARQAVVRLICWQPGGRN